MNEQHVKEWIAALRDPDNKQITGTLARRLGHEDEVGYCCLGLGCEVAGIPVYIDLPSEIINSNNELVEVVKTADDLPPFAFHRWLGLDRLTDVGMGDVYVDWPDLLDRGGEPLSNLTCAELNDTAHLTFSQIADVLEYFGISA